MAELSRRVLHARRHVDVALDSAQVEQGLARLSRRIVERQRRKRAASVAALACLVGLVWFAWLREPAPLVVATADGSVASALVADTTLALSHESADEVVLELANGASHFEVARKPTRRYRVRAGAVTVQVLGTAFDVQRAPGRVLVRVQRGAVQVAWPEGTTVLLAGAERWFSERAARPAQPQASSTSAPAALERDIVQPEPVIATALDVSAAAEPLAPTAPAARARSKTKVRTRTVRTPPPVQPTAWRELARAGKHREAFASLGTAEVDDLDGLLLAADAARLSGHAREAMAHLTRLVDRYPQDVRAQLAAFTLGRLALYELGEPRLAARSFARAHALDPAGELAADALAREAEAHHRAGDRAEARAAAERYLVRYPNGAWHKQLSSYLTKR